MEIDIVSPGFVEVIAKETWPLVEKAFQRGGGLTAPEVLDECRFGTSEMWLILDGKPALPVAIAVAFTRFEVWPEDGRILRTLGVGATGHQLRRWLPAFHEAVRARGRLLGARKIVAEGRYGWGRALSPTRPLKPVRYVFEEVL